MPGAVETLDLSSLGQLLVRMGAPPDLTPVLRQTAVYLRGVSTRAFSESKSPAGEAWAPLAPATLRQRRLRGKGAKPLVDTGLMRSSVTTNVRGTTLFWGSNLQRFEWHQTGTRHMPARRSVEVTPAILDWIAKRTADHAAKVLMAR